MPTYRQGRHEHGQNFLTDRRTIATIVHLLASTHGPLVEIGAGEGALTLPLARLGRELTAIEIDPRLAQRLQSRCGPGVRVVHADFLHYRLPTTPHAVVGNLPFHLTTAILRKLLHAPGWTEAILLTQWEVARRRAGVGGATMMTAQWAPWFDFAVHGRVPADAFTPRPSVDGGILALRRNPTPEIPPAARRRYQALVHRVYTGRGRGLAQILARTGLLPHPRAARAWLRRHGLRDQDLPNTVSAEAWIDLFRTTGTSPPPR